VKYEGGVWSSPERVSVAVDGYQKVAMVSVGQNDVPQFVWYEDGAQYARVLHRQRFPGGLSAAIITNFIQGILTVVLSFMILPSALGKVGGIEGLHQSINPDMLKIVAKGEITIFYIK